MPARRPRWCPSRGAPASAARRGRPRHWRAGPLPRARRRRRVATGAPRTPAAPRSRRDDRRSSPTASSGEATSPAACPPKPSATTSRRASGRTANASSLPARRRPGWVWPAASMLIGHYTLHDRARDMGPPRAQARPHVETSLRSGLVAGGGATPSTLAGGALGGHLPRVSASRSAWVLATASSSFHRDVTSPSSHPTSSIDASRAEGTWPLPRIRSPAGSVPGATGRPRQLPVAPAAIKPPQSRARVAKCYTPRPGTRTGPCHAFASGGCRCVACLQRSRSSSSSRGRRATGPRSHFAVAARL